MRAPLPLDDQLCFSLYSASMAINRAYKPVLDGLGLTYPQLLVLQAVHEQAGRTVGAIALRLALDASTVTPVVKRMETAGLLTRTRNPNDERQVRVELTVQGHALWERTGCLADTMMERSGLTIEEIAAFNRQVRTLWAMLTRDANGHDG